MEPELIAQAVSRSTQRLKQTGPKKYSTLTFRTDPVVRHERHKARELALVPKPLLEEIKKAASGDLKWPLYVYGDVGVGKTRGGLCVADHVASAEWFTFEEWWQATIDVKKGDKWFTSGGELTPGGYRELAREVKWTVEMWWRYLTRIPLVVVDDVGVRGASEAAREAFKTLLDLRSDRPLIVTSNIDMAGIEEVFDGRIRDRLESGTVVRLKGRSKR